MPVYVVQNDFGHLGDALTLKARRIVRKTIADIHREVDISFSEEKHGRTYIVGGTPGHPIEHTASAPGEAPAIDTGNLMNSVTHQMTDDTEGEVAVGAEYGVYLELGIARVAARPFLGPAAERMYPQFERALERVFDG